MTAADGHATIPRALWRDPSVSSHAKLVYIALDDNADDFGRAMVSHATIAENAGLSPSSVKRALKELRDRGIVSWQRRTREDGGAVPSIYTLHPAGGLT